jgi:hypothetical protein
MKNTAIFLSSLLIISACNKPVIKPPEAPHPRMQLINLADTAVTFGHTATFDLDGNGEKDIHFGTLLVDDQLNQQDKKQWLAGTSFNASLPVNKDENIPMFRLLDSIPVTDFSGYYWYDVSSVILTQKIIACPDHPFGKEDGRKRVTILYRCK